jgi:hypothetical protein
MNILYWAFAVRPLCRPKAAGRLPATVVVFRAAERRGLVDSCRSAVRRSDRCKEPWNVVKRV